MTVESIANARIDGVGLKPLIAAIPPSWRREAEQAVGPVPTLVTALLQLAPSTTSAGEAFSALAAVKRAPRRQRVRPPRRRDPPQQPKSQIQSRRLSSPL